MEIKKIGVIGTGTMGAGIMQISALNGYEVVGQDIKEEFLKNGQRTIDRFLRIAVRREKSVTAEQAELIQQKLKWTMNQEDLADCDLIIEAAVEKMEIKKQIFGNLDKICKPDTILASNTSSLSILEMAEATQRPAKFVGLHFFNPVTHMQLVEIIKHDRLSEDTYINSKDYVTKIGKEYITCIDVPGFVVNYILMQYLLGAVRAADEGIATIEDIDKGMKLGANHPMGPFELLDRIGLDVALHVAESIYEKVALPQFQPSQTLIDHVNAGNLGKKSGKGFYNYK